MKMIFLTHRYNSFSWEGFAPGLIWIVRGFGFGNGISFLQTLTAFGSWLLLSLFELVTTDILCSVWFYCPQRSPLGGVVILVLLWNVNWKGRQLLDKDVIQTGWLTPCFKSLAKFLFLLWFQESQNLVPLPSPVRHLRPRRPRSLYWKVFKEHRKGRCAQMSTSTVPKPFACKELPNTQGTLLQGLTNLITLPSSSILWPQSRPWRRLKTTTHLCSLSMWELTSPRSRHQWKSCTTLRLPKSTLWSGTC